MTINAVIHRNNVEHIAAIVDAAISLGASRIEIAHAQYYGWALQNRAALMLTREQARGREDHQGKKLPDDRPRGPQPDLLVTNYSMLEYMLCRPQDAVFFGPGLRSIVLDEAHL